jgi:hypothetical protein
MLKKASDFPPYSAGGQTLPVLAICQPSNPVESTQARAVFHGKEKNNDPRPALFGKSHT